jgi:hypothetical protein
MSFRPSNFFSNLVLKQRRLMFTDPQMAQWHGPSIVVALLLCLLPMAMVL